MNETADQADHGGRDETLLERAVRRQLLRLDETEERRPARHPGSGVAQGHGRPGSFAGRGLKVRDRLTPVA